MANPVDNWRKGKTAGAVLAVISATLFGLIPLFSLPLLKSGIPSHIVSLYRFGLSAFFLWPIMYFSGRLHKLSREQLLHLALAALFYFLDVQLFFYAFHFLPGAVVATLEYLSPAFVLLLSLTVFRQTIHWTAWLAITLCICGVALLSGCMDEFSFDFSYLNVGHTPTEVVTGVALGLLAAFFTALYIISFQTKILSRIEPLTATLYVISFGTIYCLCDSLFREDMSWLTNSSQLLPAIFLALLTCVISNLTLVMAIERIGSAKTAILGVLEPLTAAFMTLIFFDESLSAWMLLGGGLAIIGALLATMTR